MLEVVVQSMAACGPKSGRRRYMYYCAVGNCAIAFLQTVKNQA